MPSRNSIKIYAEDSFYHIYNRGVEKRIIFEDDQDYKVFLKYLREILSPVSTSNIKTTFHLRGQSFEAVKAPLKNYADEISLHAYCLMPNHFHFLIKQKNKTSLEGFMRALMTRYSMYFNRRYNRVGSLFQGRYKAIIVNNESYLLHLSRYIHLNPLEVSPDLIGSYSSYADYLHKRNSPWVKPGEILSYFDQANIIDFKKIASYKKFVENYDVNSLDILGDMVLE